MSRSQPAPPGDTGLNVQDDSPLLPSGISVGNVAHAYVRLAEHFGEENFLAVRDAIDKCKFADRSRGRTKVMVTQEYNPKPFERKDFQCSDAELLIASLEPKIDGLQGTGWANTLDEVKQAVEFAFQFDMVLWCPHQPVFDGIMWEHSALTFTHGKVGYRFDEKENRWHWRISVFGEYWKQILFRDQFRILNGLVHAYKFKPTRIDLAVDDYARRRTPQDIANYAEEGKVSLVRSYEVVGKAPIGESVFDNLTVYLGSRRSEKFLRVYDALGTHGINAIRFEGQFRDNKAVKVTEELLSVQPSPDRPEENFDQIFAQKLASLVLGCVEFVVEPVKSKANPSGAQLCRTERMAWWQLLLDEVGGNLRVPSGQKSPSMPRAVKWIDRQVIVWLSTLRDAVGSKQFAQWLEFASQEARKRYRKYHQVWIDFAKESGWHWTELFNLIEVVPSTASL